LITFDRFSSLSPKRLFVVKKSALPPVPIPVENIVASSPLTVKEKPL